MDRAQKNMAMDTPASQVSVRMGTDNAHKPRETLVDPLHGQLLSQFAVQHVSLAILWRKGDDIMTQVHIPRISVFSVLPIQLLCLDGKGEGRTVDPLQIVFLPGDVFSVLIDEEFSPFIRLIHQIIQDAPIVLPPQRMLS